MPDVARKKRALVLLLFAFCAEVRAQPTTKNAAATDPGLQLFLRPTATTIYVTWSMQDASLNIHEYEVALQEKGFVREIAYASDPKTTFFNLEPCVEYSVSVQPFDKQGRNVGNHAVDTITTHASEPPALLKLAVPNITAHSLALSWERPATACEITAYNITYSGVSKWGPRTEHTGSSTIGRGDANSASTNVIDGLKPYTDYTITLTAGTKAGKGKSAEVQSSTLQDLPSKPTNLKALQISDTFITMMWKEPQEQNGAVDRYNVAWYINGMYIFSEIVSHTVHTITNLSPCTTYTVGVAGITESGQGQYNEITATTNIQAPHLDPTCHRISDQTVSVTWGKPKTVCTINGFRVSYRGSSGDPNAMSTEDVLSSVFSYSISTTQGSSGTICVAALMTDKTIGPQACCEPPKPSAPKNISPKTTVATENPEGGVRPSKNGAEQFSKGHFNIGIGVAVVVVIVSW